MLKHSESTRVEELRELRAVERAALTTLSTRWPAVRRCMLTAQADPETTEDALATGVLHKAMRKPWDNGELIGVLKALTERSE